MFFVTLHLWQHLPSEAELCADSSSCYSLSDEYNQSWNASAESSHLSSCWHHSEGQVSLLVSVRTSCIRQNICQHQFQERRAARLRLFGPPGGTRQYSPETKDHISLFFLFFLNLNLAHIWSDGEHGVVKASSNFTDFQWEPFKCELWFTP